jgi:plasmid stabilization system protein ParE
VRIEWTRRYLRELEAIGDYIAEQSPRSAARVVDEIHAKLDDCCPQIPSSAVRATSEGHANW